MSIALHNRVNTLETQNAALAEALLRLEGRLKALEQSTRPPEAGKSGWPKGRPRKIAAQAEGAGP